MPNPKTRIPISNNADDQIKLAKDVLKRHKALGTKSPLAGLDMDTFETQLGIADAANEAARELARQAESATQNRDNALGGSRAAEKPGTVKFLLRAARDTLAGLNRGNEKQLGDWGFTVDDSPRPAARVKPPTGGA